jgi:hypothetical protein
MGMYYLFYKGLLFGIVIGIIAVIFVIPVIQQLESVVINALEVINGYTTRNVTKRNAEIQIIQSETEDKLTPVSSSAIGFEVPNSEYIYGDECNSRSDNIGFK